MAPKGCAFHEPSKNDVMIGRGGFGAIYTTPGRECVVKVSHASHPCHSLSHEYTVTSLLRDAFDKVLTEKEKKFIGVIRPSKFATCGEGRRCCFTMQHLQPLLPGDAYITQAYLALPKHNKILKSAREVRGIYRGATELQNILDKHYAIPLTEIAKYIGVAVASMHYGAGFNGLDSEIVIARTTRSPTPKVYIIDHDQNGPMNVSKPRSIVSMLSTLLGSGEPYYPFEGPLAPWFRQGYVQKAERLGFGKLANDVMDAAATEYVHVPPLPL